MVMKDRQSINPQWDDDNDDPSVENIIRALFGELGQRPWRWLKKHWRDEWVLINAQSAKLKVEQNVDSNESVVSDDGARKRAHTEASPPSHNAGILAAMDQHFDAMKQHFGYILRSFETEMLLSFNKVEDEMINLVDRVAAVEKKLGPVVTEKQAGESKVGVDEQAKADATHRVSFNPSPSFGRKESEIKETKRSTKKSYAKETNIQPRNTRSRARLQNNLP